MYKDKDKQRLAVRDATRRYRARKQGITEQAKDVIPCDTLPVIPDARLNKPQSHSPMMVGYVPPQE